MTNAPQHMMDLSKEPQSKTAIFLYHQTNGPPKSRVMFNPQTDVFVGQLAVTFMPPSDAEREWMGDIHYSLIRVTELLDTADEDGNIVKGFKGLFYEPSLRVGHYRKKAAWPTAEEWIKKALVPLQHTVKKKGRNVLSQWITDPIDLEYVQFSTSLTQTGKICHPSRKSVLEAVLRCQEGGRHNRAVLPTEERLCDELDEGGAEG